MAEAELDQIRPSTGTRKRPMYLTIIAIGLVLWGVITTLSFGAQTIAIVLTGRGPFLAVFFMLYMHAVWICILAAGVGIIRCAPWSRLLLIGALIGLLATSLTPFSEGYPFLPTVIVYGGIILTLFTRRSNTYFSALSDA
ncbi:MAG: hypothetical protein QM639_17425 [Rhodocyclaceae bacterium]